MSRWHDALRAYRRGELTASAELVFVLCAEDHRGATLASEGDIYLCNPEGKSKLLSDIGIAQTMGL